MNKDLTGFERYEGELLMTEFLFLGELSLYVLCFFQPLHEMQFCLLSRLLFC